MNLRMLRRIICIWLAGTFQAHSDGPSPIEQYAIELINRARLSPAAEAQRFGISLNEGPPQVTLSADPKPPLAIDLELMEAAENHFC